jgi:hypothetical protein
MGPPDSLAGSRVVACVSSSAFVCDDSATKAHKLVAANFKVLEDSQPGENWRKLCTT